MNTNKTLSLLIIILNAIGIIFLTYFAIPYLTHDTAIVYPNAMLPAESWDRAGMILTIGLLPFVTVNVLGYLLVRFKVRYIRLLFLAPGILYLAIVVSYWVGAV